MRHGSEAGKVGTAAAAAAAASLCCARRYGAGVGGGGVGSAARRWRFHSWIAPAAGRGLRCRGSICGAGSTLPCVRARKDKGDATIRRGDLCATLFSFQTV